MRDPSRTTACLLPPPPLHPTKPLLSCPTPPKLSWAAQRARLCVTPCQVLLEAVRWQPPSLSASPCPLWGWGGAIALHPRAPRCCDRKAWLAVTRPRCGGTLRREEEGRGPRWWKSSSTGVLFYLSGTTSRVGEVDCVRACASQVWAWPPSTGTLLGHITYMVQWQRCPWMRLDGLVGEKVA